MVDMSFGDSEDVLDGLALNMEKYADNFPKQLDIAMAAAAELVRQKLVEITPKRTGFTAEAWVVIPMGIGEFVITNSNEPIASFLSEGTSPHPIDPVSARVLHWVSINAEGAAGDVFAMHVDHPGTQPLNLEDVAMLEVEPMIDDLIDAADDAAAREAGL
jgi:hypothetical protein